MGNFKLMIGNEEVESSILSRSTIQIKDLAGDGGCGRGFS
jgi:hypothetical protein